MNETSRPSTRSGFTLVEAAVATALVGIAMAALLTALRSGTRTNEASRRLTQAVFLAQEIREWTLRLPFEDPEEPGETPGSEEGDPQTVVDDLDDLMGVTFGPPRDAYGSAITDMSGWSETITLTWRDSSNVATVVADGSSDVVHVQVSISYQGRQVLTTDWLVTRRSQS